MGWCERCDCSVRNWSAHRNRSDNHWMCGDCGIDWSSWTGLREHWVQSPAHAYCQHCDEHFDDAHDLYQHYDVAHYWCRPCMRIFQGGELGLQEHNRQSHANRWCVPCKRLFQSPSNLLSHQRGSAHTSSNVRCPGRGCNLTFVSISAMTLHLEQGRCPSGLTRARVNEQVVALDRHNIITNPARLISGPGGSSLPPSHTTYVSDRAYDPSTGWWECFLCERTFQTRHALAAHINSPRHQDKIYRCPKSDCRKEFSTLSGIFQHAESGVCGVYKTRAVQDVMAGLTSSMRRIAL